MGIYGNEYANERIDEKSQMIFLDLFTTSVLEDYIDEDNDIDIVQEGTNFEGFKDLVRAKKVMRTYKKNYRKAMKSGDYKKAAKVASDMKKELEVIEKHFVNLDWDDTSTAVWGFLAGLGIELAQAMAISLLLYYSIAGVATAAGKHGITAAAKAGNLSKMFGSYRTALKGISMASDIGLFGGLIKELVTYIKYLSFIADKRSSYAKNTKTPQEAVNYLRTMLMRLLNTCKEAADKLVDNAKKAEEINKEKNK